MNRSVEVVVGGSRPSNLPPGSRRINEDPRTKDHVHKIKLKYEDRGIGPETNIWITPEGLIVVTGQGGEMEEIGDLTEHDLHSECVYLPIPPGRTRPDGIPRPIFPPFIPDPFTGAPPKVDLFPDDKPTTEVPSFEWPFDFDWGPPSLDESGQPLMPFGRGGRLGGGRVGGGLRIPVRIAPGGIF